MATLKPLIDLYNNSVKKEDKKGYADIYKKAFKVLIKEINKEIKGFSKTFKQFTKITPTNIKYLDGYFLYGMGTNSVIEFHIKEIPEWLFGIWFHPYTKVPKEKQKEFEQYDVSGTFFTQFEETIDKFKPSASGISIEFDLGIDKLVSYPKKHRENICNTAFIIAKKLNYLYHEPELSFCKDFCCWNYNEEYHSRKEAKKVLKEYKKQKEKDVKLVKKVTKKELKFYFKEVIPYFKNAFIDDRGDCISPRYILMAPYEDQLEDIRLSADTDLDIEITNNVIPGIEKKLKVLKTYLEKQDKKMKYTYYHGECINWVTLYKKDRCKKIKWNKVVNPSK